MEIRAPSNAEELVLRSDEDLVKLIYNCWADKAIYNAAQAELTRRQMEAVKEFNRSSTGLISNQTEAINRFNTSSTRLALVMIGLSIGMMILSVVSFFKKN